MLPVYKQQIYLIVHRRRIKFKMVMQLTQGVRASLSTCAFLFQYFIIAEVGAAFTFGAYGSAPVTIKIGSALALLGVHLPNIVPYMGIFY